MKNQLLRTAHPRLIVRNSGGGGESSSKQPWSAPAVRSLMRVARHTEDGYLLRRNYEENATYPQDGPTQS